MKPLTSAEIQDVSSSIQDPSPLPRPELKLWSGQSLRQVWDLTSASLSMSLVAPVIVTCICELFRAIASDTFETL